MAFIVLCEGYLGIEPHFELWRYFFSISLLKRRDRARDLLVLMGYITKVLNLLNKPGDELVITG